MKPTREDLVACLVADCRPVGRLAPPYFRTMLWTLGSLLYAAFIVSMVGLRPDFWLKLMEPSFLVEVLSGAIVGVFAAFAAISSGYPDRSPRVWLVALPPLAVWLGTLGVGCLQTVLRFGFDGLDLSPDPSCFPSIALAGIGPAVLIFLMIRRNAPIARLTTSALAALAASAMGAAALRLFHTKDASAMVLIWQFGSVAVFTAMGALLGRHLLRWPNRLKVS